MNARTLACLLAVGLYPFLSGCATTVGQEFRDIIAHIDAQCRRDQQGPYYVAGIPKHPRTGDCPILTLQPADPLATKEGRKRHHREADNDESIHAWRARA